MTTENTNNHDAIASALVQAIGELSDVRKGKEAKVQMKSGGSYGYKYADLADVLSSVRQTLSKHSLAVIQSPVSHDNDTVSIYTTIVHGSGQQMTFGPLTLPAGRTAQETGSAITYGRRYALLSVLGLAAEDDDGATAAPRQTRAKAVQGNRTTQMGAHTVTARSDAENAIRQALSNVASPVASAIKAQFKDEFGMSLAELPVSQHNEAFEWVTLAIAMSENNDAEWVAEAKGQNA